MIHTRSLPAAVVLVVLLFPRGLDAQADDLPMCGLTACQSLDLAKSFVEITMSKMMRLIKPEALEQVFHDMGKLELLIRKVDDLDRDVKSLFMPVWPISDAVPRWSMCAEGPCSCSMETRTVSCWRLELMYHVPRKQRIPYDTRIMDLGMNNLKFLHKNSFKRLTQLIELDLNDNQLELLPGSIFYDLENLQHLKLHKNHLLYLYEDLFQDCRGVKTIDISYNRLEGLPPNIFKKLLNLHTLHLSNNQIQGLSQELFFDLENLEDLDLSENLILELPHYCFSKLHKLKRLKLQFNRIGRLPYGIFDGLYTLEALFLQHNEIESLPSHVFRELGNLTILELTNNRINHIGFRDFITLGSLRSLFLGQNLIRQVTNKTFVGTPKLEKLHLFSNNIETVELAAFSGLNNLTWLLLNNNLLRDLPNDIFKRTPNLLRLQIDSNKFMKLPYGLLDNLEKVEQVKLSMNPWHCDCFILYLTDWLHRNLDKIWDRPPKCRGPGDLGGRPVYDMSFNYVCDGQWASMTNIKGRV